MSSVTTEVAGSTKELSIGRILRYWLKQREADPPRLPRHHWKVLRALAACRTAVLGGRVYRCKECGRDHCVPHSCRDRHCPGCQPMLGYEWMQRQTEALLPVPYFHLVFTLPHQLNGLIGQNQGALYKLLFDSVSATLLEFGRNHFKAQIGITAVLHTWDQKLGAHYHLHCIVTGGGFKLDGSGWAQCREHWLFPVRALSKVFRGKYRAGLRQLYRDGELQFHGQLQDNRTPSAFSRLLKNTMEHDWVVFAKRPFAGPEQVIAYLARYTHRVGITNKRLEKFDPVRGEVAFSYQDRTNGDVERSQSLPLNEFVRRLCRHILPFRFVKIRHYGLLSNGNRSNKIALVRSMLGVKHSPNAEATLPPRPSNQPCCPYCQSVYVSLVRVIHPPTKMGRAPPQNAPCIQR